MGIVESITAVILSAIGITGTAAAVGSTAFAIVSTLVALTLSIGLYFLATFLTPTTKPSDLTTSFRKAIGPRYRHYGKVKVSGQWIFCGANDGSLYKVIALGQGPFTSIESYWIDSNEVTRDSNGYCTTSVDLDGNDSTNYKSKARILSRLGTTSQIFYSELGSVFPQWTYAHVGYEVASILCIQYAVKSSEFSKIFPNSWNTNYRVIAKTTAIENPLTSVTAYDDNASDIIRDYLYSEYGFRLPKSILTTPLAQAGWESGHTKSAAAYNVKAGGTEKRYRIWGSYSLEERPADILAKMLAACDARLKITSDGGITIDVGDYVEPDVIFTDDDIVGFSEFGRGKDILSTANIIKSTFTSPLQDYLETDADEWIDEADVEARGGISTSLDFLFAPSHSQCRRLMKINAYRANPKWTGAFELTLKGLAAISERFVRIQFTPFGIDDVFEIKKLTINSGENNIVKSVTIIVTSMEEEAFNWDYETEEGTEPVASDITEDTVIPIPTGFNVEIDRILVSGSYYPYAHLSWNEPPWDSLYVTAEYKLSSDTKWTTLGSNIADLYIDSPILSDGKSYDFRIAQSTFSGTLSDYTDTITLTAIADTTAPGIITNLVATGAVGQVDFTWKTPNSSNYVACNIYRNTSDDEETAIAAHTEWGAASSSDSYSDESLTAGSYYYWFRSRNGSGVESASVASGEVIVT